MSERYALSWNLVDGPVQMCGVVVVRCKGITEAAEIGEGLCDVDFLDPNGPKVSASDSRVVGGWCSHSSYDWDDWDRATEQYVIHDVTYIGKPDDAELEVPDVVRATVDVDCAGLTEEGRKAILAGDIDMLSHAIAEDRARFMSAEVA